MIKQLPVEQAVMPALSARPARDLLRRGSSLSRPTRRNPPQWTASSTPYDQACIVTDYSASPPWCWMLSKLPQRPMVSSLSWLAWSAQKTTATLSKCINHCQFDLRRICHRARRRFAGALSWSTCCKQN